MLWKCRLGMLSLFFSSFKLFALPSSSSFYDEWHVYHDSFLDNREYGRIYQKDETIFGSRFGLELEKGVEEKITVSLGYDFLLEFGARTMTDGTTLINEELPGNTGNVTTIKRSDSIVLQPAQIVSYVSADLDKARFYGGIFRYSKMGKIHDFLWDSRWQYYKPFIQGFLISIPFPETDLWIDWTSRQTDSKFETFVVGLKGALPLIWGFDLPYQATMFHYAGPASIHVPVRDNLGEMIGLRRGFQDLWFDSLSLSVHLLLSQDRQRESYTDPSTKVLIPKEKYYGRSFLYSAEAQKGPFRLEALHNHGQRHQMMLGDSFYRATQYTKVALSWAFINYKKAKALLEWAEHITDHGADPQQKLTLSIRL